MMTFRETERATLHDWTGELVGLRGRGELKTNPRGVARVLPWLITPANFPGEYSGQAVAGKTKVSTRHIAYFCYCEKLQ